jgi:hypothetical protein
MLCTHWRVWAAVHFGWCVRRILVVKKWASTMSCYSFLSPSSIRSSACQANIAGLLPVTLSFLFFPLISLSYPDKYIIILIVIVISYFILLVLISIFFFIFPFVNVLIFFQFNPWFLICVNNVFWFGHSTFYFFSLPFCQSFYDFRFYPSNQVYDFLFILDSIFLVLISIFLSFFLLLKVYFFQFNPWFLIYVYNFFIWSF